MKRTVVQNTATRWDRLPANTRTRLVKFLWLVTWLGLLAGLVDRVWYEFVVLFSGLHAVFILLLLNFRIMAFPAQVRIAYLAWVAIGTYVPHMTVLIYITTVGLAANLFLGYCPLARMLYLLPWNRNDRFDLNLLRRVFLTPPVAGQFRPPSR